ncbi:MAG: hypothetical protein R3F50_05560 [Gammaproteobacteria bacterium]
MPADRSDSGLSLERYGNGPGNTTPVPDLSLIKKLSLRLPIIALHDGSLPVVMTCLP